MKKVGFNEITFYDFNYILGDNPAVSCGAPLALGSDLVSTGTVEVDYFEENR